MIAPRGKGWAAPMVVVVAASVSLLGAPLAAAQIGPGEFDPAVGGDPSVGEGSQEFMDDPDAGDAGSVGENSEQFIDDPDAGDAGSVGENSEQFADDPDAGDAPSIGGANEPFDQPGEGPPYGRPEPFGD